MPVIPPTTDEHFYFASKDLSQTERRSELLELAHWLATHFVVVELRHDLVTWKNKHGIPEGFKWINPYASNCFRVDTDGRVVAA